MKKTHGIKTLVASLLVTVALAGPALVLSAGDNPQAELLFEGAQLVYRDDGTVQAIFDVSIHRALNSNGASFYLDYNPDYITPSDMTTNAPIAGVGAMETDAFFASDQELFYTEDGAGKKTAVSPFSETVNGRHYSSVNPTTHVIHMALQFSQDSYDPEDYTQTELIPGTITTNIKNNKAKGKIGVLHNVDYGVNYQGRDRYAVNIQETPTSVAPDMKDRKVTLGQLSFQVDRDHLAEMVDYFNGLDVSRNHWETTPKEPWVETETLATGSTPQKTFLLDISSSVPMGEDPWTISYYDNSQEYRKLEMKYTPKSTQGVTDHYIFNFDGKTIVKVEATEPDFTINAYQNYTAGGVDDLALSLGRFSPTVTVTYADGSQEVVPFPWGSTSAGYTPKYVKKDDVAAGTPWGSMTASPINPYDPTANVANPGVGTDYVFSQKFQIFQTTADGSVVRDPSGNPKVKYTFPTPVTAHMRVTPITVLSVTADDLEKTYPVDSVLDQVQNADDLNLPKAARVVTDVVPSGVSLTVPLQGWKPTQADSAWPSATNAGKAMNSLKADSYTAPVAPATVGYPYWPDTDDRLHLNANDTANYAPQNYIGTYTFQTSTADHQTARNVLKKDITDAFRWLTVPKEEYEMPKAHRKLVGSADYKDPKDYLVKWVSTVTETATNGAGQPTLTLSVSRAAATGDIHMAAGSVFRVWLPNGLEIGTGLSNGLTTPVDDWFHRPDGGASVPEGFYRTEAATESAGPYRKYHKLITNPNDPNVATDAYAPQRETLRRYINLGGWYQVAICENPGDTTPIWTDPIPVYVPPRRNEYQESKIYNFIGEDAALCHWPGGVGDTLNLPRGAYTPVGPLDAGHTDAQGVGLPIYQSAAFAGLTDGRSNPANVFAPGNLRRPLAGVTRYTESYGVRTTYDGQTGAQPGEIFTVKVNQADTTHTADWTAPTSAETLHSTVDPGQKNTPATATNVYKYGPTPLYDGHQVMGFGYVNQPSSNLTAYKATLRRQLPEKAAQKERIKLVSASPTGITRVDQSDVNSNVTLVTYDNQTEGYTVRQTYVLTIRNVGDVDIYGLDIDGLTDGYPDDKPGGRFEMLQAPASFLPVGGETTFTLTYVYDLRSPTKYRDTLYITSNGHDNVGKGKHEETKQYDTGAADDDYLLDFDAVFSVTDSPLHKVDVVYKPANGNMGTANLIVGEQGTSPVTMNYTPTTRTYPKDDQVFVVVNQKDEYAVKSITYNKNGSVITVPVYKAGAATGVVGSAPLDPGTQVYVFDMPDHDVTVTVDFYEPFLSKLRLEDLIDFSAPTADNDLKTSNAATPAPKDPEHTYRVWRKTYTAAEKTAATAWENAVHSGNKDYYLMTQGAARPHNADPDLEGQQFLSTENQYLVVIDAEDDLSQVETKIRRVVYHEDYQGTDTAYRNGKNYEITLNVQMDVYPYNVEKQTNGTYHWGTSAYEPEVVYTPTFSSGASDKGYGPRPAFTGTPNGALSASAVPPADYGSVPAGTTPASDSSVHTSAVFDSPAKGQSSYVRITLSGVDPEDNSNTTQYRYFFLEIHRKTDEPQVQLHYGNSPYGMIMNDDRFNAAAQNDAKAAFKKGYTFAGANHAVTPDVVWNSKDMIRVTYWREAWVKNRRLFEPESLTGYVIARNADGTQKFADPETKLQPIYTVDPSVYDESENLDLNDYAYFAILGQDMREPGVVKAWDSSGRLVDVNKITAVAMDVDWAENDQGVTLLDTTKTKQAERFAGGTDHPVIDLGVQGRTFTALKEHDATTPPPAITPGTTGVTVWPATATTTQVTPPGGGAPEDVTTWSRVDDIRPGRYAIVYSYTDFDGTSTLRVDRPFVILRSVGDVNTDGVRDSGYTKKGSDEYALEDRIGNDPLGCEAGLAPSAAHPHGAVYPFANIFKYRVADVNNDRNVNNIDANLVDKNVREEKAGTKPASELWLKFYDPLHYGLD